MRIEPAKEVPAGVFPFHRYADFVPYQRCRDNMIELAEADIMAGIRALQQLELYRKSVHIFCIPLEESSMDPGAAMTPVRPWPATRVRIAYRDEETSASPTLRARQLLDSVAVTTIAGLRDRALIGMMVYSLARIGAVLGMKVDDVYTQQRRL
ncbi:MAG TPA: hypothetical protein VMB73_27250 [Acetobacteraceae bacterium]|nr:hypothetical protein [Acetobacteraceae bacterium]